MFHAQDMFFSVFIENYASLTNMQKWTSYKRKLHQVQQLTDGETELPQENLVQTMKYHKGKNAIPPQINRYPILIR